MEREGGLGTAKDFCSLVLPQGTEQHRIQDFHEAQTFCRREWRYVLSLTAAWVLRIPLGWSNKESLVTEWTLRPYSAGCSEPTSSHLILTTPSS